jgi:hypothetical protein
MAPNPTDTVLALREFPGAGDPAHLLPRRTRDNAPFFDALREGRLALQACASCERLRYPIAPVCPHCGGRESRWRDLSGRGTVHSFVRYRRSYLAEFEPLMPYVVASVELDEGVRIFGRLAESGDDAAIGMPVRAIVERWPGGECVHAFVAATDGEAR